MPTPRVRYNDVFKRYHLVLTDDNNDVQVDMGYLMPDNLKSTAGLETLLPDTFDPFSDGSIVRISSSGQKHKFSPAGTSKKDRGEALFAAAAAAVNGDKFILAPFEYEAQAAINWAANNITVEGNGAMITRKNASQNQVCIFDTGSSYTNKITVRNLLINGNGDNVTLSGERGEGLKVIGDGNFYGVNCFAYNAPVGAAAAVNFYFDLDDGHVYLLGCIADDPGWANYRIRCRSFEALGCHSLVTTHKTGAKARFYDMDGTNIDEVRILGGRWFTNQTYEVQAVFDPGPGNSARKVTIDGVQMNFYKNHTNSTGDSFVKFDLVEDVVFQNIDQSHVQPRLHTSFDPYTHGVYETLLNLGQCENVIINNVQADATPHPSSPADTIFIKNCIISNSVFGKNSKLDHAMWNINSIQNLTIRDSSFLHVTGSGSQASGNNCIFQNGTSSSKNQKVILDNVTIGYKFTEIGPLFRHIREIGHVQFGNFTTIKDGSSPLISAPNPSQRIMAAVKIGDPLTALLQWNPIVMNAPSPDTGVFAQLGSTTWDHVHKAPVDPGTAAGDWFGGTIIGKAGARVRNTNYGNGGNGHPEQFIKTGGNTFVDN